MPAETRRLGVYTTFYPAAERFLPAWSKSIAAQSDQEFELWIGLDGMSPDRIAAQLDGGYRVHWCPAPAGVTPAQLRGRTLERMAEVCDVVVLVDSDDVLEPERIAAARDSLAAHDASGCALRIMDERGRPLEPVFQPPVGVSLADLLPRYNVFGLSNTAYRTDLLRRCLPVPDDCVLVDWLLATRAWMAGARMTFDFTPRMRYRQYRENLARVLGPFSVRDVLAATELVLGHYRIVLDGAEGTDEPSSKVAAEQERVKRFHNAITGAQSVLQEYVTRLNQLSPWYVWWWCVAHPDLEQVWNH